MAPLRRLLAVPALVLAAAALAPGAPAQYADIPGRPRVIPLPDVRLPRRLCVEGGKIYILAEDLSIRSFADGRVLKRIGRPGEAPRDGFLPDDIAVLPDRLAVMAGPVVRLYTLDGEFVSQARRPADALVLVPLGGRFVGFGYGPGRDGAPGTLLGRFYDGEGRPEAPAYGRGLNEASPPGRRPSPYRSGPPGAATAEPAMPEAYPSARVQFGLTGDRFYLADPAGALAVSVFDAQGRAVTVLRPPAGAGDGAAAPADYRKAIRAFQGESAGPAAYRGAVRPAVPALLGFRLDGDKIVLVTPARVEDRYEMIVLSLQGAVLERAARFPITPAFDIAAGASGLWDVEDGKVCWIEPEGGGRGFVLRIR